MKLTSVTIVLPLVRSPVVEAITFANGCEPEPPREPEIVATAELHPERAGAEPFVVGIAGAGVVADQSHPALEVPRAFRVRRPVERGAIQGESLAHVVGAVEPRVCFGAEAQFGGQCESRRRGSRTAPRYGRPRRGCNRCR